MLRVRAKYFVWHNDLFMLIAKGRSRFFFFPIAFSKYAVSSNPLSFGDKITFPRLEPVGQGS